MTATDELAQVPYPREAEREQRAIFDQPGPANVQSGVALVEDAERADLGEDKALAELEGATPAVRKVMETNGRHTSDRLAAEQQWRRDQTDTNDAVSVIAQGTSARHQANARAQAAREQQHQPRGEDFVGVGQLSDTGYRRWVEHCAAGYGAPPQLLLDDDAAWDAWMDDQAAALPPEDVHDIDDTMEDSL